jgi:hypothetical protein
MRRKLIRTVGTVACATAIVATIGVESTSASPGKRLGETLVVIQSPPRQQHLDLGDPGPSPGDLLVFASTLANQARTPIGDLHIACTQNFDQVAVCVGIFNLSRRASSQSTPRPCSPTERWEWSPAGPASFRMCEAKPTSILSPMGRPRSRSTSSGRQAAAPRLRQAHRGSGPQRALHADAAARSAAVTGDQPLMRPVS